MTPRPFAPATEPTVSLATFRRSGAEVRTPVWIAGDDRRLYVFSEGDAGKVKRIRATGRARLAACDLRGRVEPGAPWLEARGRIVAEPEVVELAYERLHRKYGWKMKAVDLLAKLSGRFWRRAILEIEIADAPGP